MINNVAKLLKTWIPYIRLRSQRGTRATKKASKSIVSACSFVRKFASEKSLKNEKTHFFKRSRRAPHQKKTKNHVLCPEIKQRYSHANRAQSNFFVKKLEKTCFWKKYVSAPNEKSRNVAKLGCFDDWQSQKKSVISWFLDSGTEILLGKRKVVRCCSFLLWCS